MRYCVIILAALAITGPSYSDCGDVLLKLLADDGEGQDSFARSVAISGTTLIVGTQTEDEDGDRRGAAYLIDTVSGWTIHTLRADDGVPGDFFRRSVAITGTTAIVGAPFDDDNGESSGSAYLFDIATGEQIAKLLPDDGAEDDHFGWSVAISGTTAIVGALGNDQRGGSAGAAYLFDATTGEQLAKLLPDDGRTEDNFGVSVAISGTTAIVGAYRDDDNGDTSGSAYLFDTTTGLQIAKLLPADGARDDLFGVSVAIGATRAIVGARWHDDFGSNSGSAYLFNTITGEQVAKLIPHDGAQQDNFGISVAIDDHTAIVGANRDDDMGANSGSAYLFDITTGEQIAKLVPSDGAEEDRFGGHVAINGTTAIAASPGDDDNGPFSGSVYVFDISGCAPCVRNPEWQCDGDVDGDGQVNPVDAGLVQASFGSLDEQDLCNYDVDCDGQINPVDAGIVQSLFGTCDAPRAACP